MHVTGRTFLAIAIAGIAAGCSVSGSPPAPPLEGSAARGPAATTHYIDYVYTINYNSSDMAQYGLNPSGKPLLKPIGPNLKLGSCKNPDSMAVIPRDHLIFVACYSGEIVAVSIAKDHTLAAAKIKPVAVPSPLYVLAPHSGASHRLYVDEYPGAVAALAYSSKSLKLLHTYQTGSTYPTQMAFYTSPAKKSELFVAAAYANVACGSTTAGAILVYAQNATGALAAQTPIPACGTAYNVVVTDSNLYWAGPSVLGGYSLTKNAPLPSPKAAWPAGSGPPYYTNDLSVVHAQPSHKPADLSPNGGAGSEFAAATDNGVVVIFGDSMDPVAMSPPANGVSAGLSCKSFRRGLHIGKLIYQSMCMATVNDFLEVVGLPKQSRHLLPLAKFSPGSLPIGISIQDPCDDYEYYYYYYDYC